MSGGSRSPASSKLDSARQLQVRAAMLMTMIMSIACSSCESRSSPADAGTHSKLDPSAVAELEALGYRQFEGKAVVQSEVYSDIWPTRVTFDPNSGPICMRGT